MDQEKTGRFIAECRKQKGMTQAVLAEKLGVTDRAVSKWETGRSLPDAGIMLELTDLLGINVNELLSGEKLEKERYKEMAENNLMELKKLEELSNKRLLRLEVVIALIGILSFLAMVLIALLVEMQQAYRIAIVAAGLVILLIAAHFSIKIEREAGYYKCPHCGNRYVPELSKVYFAPHIGRTRKMRCPKCGKKGWQKKVLTR